MGRILTGDGVARLSDPKKEKAGAMTGAIVSWNLTVGLAVVVTGGGAGTVVISTVVTVSVVVGAGLVVRAGRVLTSFGLNLLRRRNAGKLLNPSLLPSSFSWPTSLLSSLWLVSFGRRLNLLGPFLLNNFLRGLVVVVVVVVVVVMVVVVVGMKVVKVGTNGEVAGAVTSSEGMKVSFYSCGHI